MGMLIKYGLLLVVALHRNYLKAASYGKTDQGLTEIPDNIPSTANVVFLGNNYITVITKYDFAGLTNMGALHMGDNEISGSGIDPDVFADNPLVELQLQNNRLGIIPNLKNIRLSLHKLTLARCSISNSNNDQVFDYPNMEHLNMFGNPLCKFPNLTVCARKLRGLILASCQLNNIPSGYFDEMTMLNNLRLERNNFVHIQDLAIKGMVMLHSINLAYNQDLQTIASSAFQGLESLANIYLSNCDKLKTFPCLMDTIVARLYLANDNISDISQSCANLVTLVELHLHHNSVGMESLAQFSLMKNVKGIYMRENPLHCVPAGTFDALDHLSILDLSYTSLVRFYVQSCDETKTGYNQHISLNNANLQTLLLVKNKLTSFPNLSSLVNLSILDLEGNLMGEVPAGSLQNKKLTSLNLKQNMISSIPADYFIGCIDLKYIDLSFNYIEQMPVVNVIGPALEVVVLEHNKLSGKLGEDTFTNLTGLKEIVLNYNDIEEIDIQFLHYAGNMTQIQLDSNNITSITDANKWCEGSTCENLIIDLNRNPIQCEKMCWAKRASNKISVKAIICSSTTWPQATLENLNCPDVTIKAILQRIESGSIFVDSNAMQAFIPQQTSLLDSANLCALWCEATPTCTTFEFSKDSEIGSCTINI